MWWNLEETFPWMYWGAFALTSFFLLDFLPGREGRECRIYGNSLQTYFNGWELAWLQIYCPHIDACIHCHIISSALKFWPMRNDGVLTSTTLYGISSSVSFHVCTFFVDGYCFWSALSSSCSTRISWWSSQKHCRDIHTCIIVLLPALANPTRLEITSVWQPK